MEMFSGNHNIFYFKVTYYDSLEGKENIETGFEIAHSYAEAALQLEEYFSDELLSIDKLILAKDDAKLILLPEEVCKNYLNEIY